MNRSDDNGACLMNIVRESWHAQACIEVRQVLQAAPPLFYGAKHISINVGLAYYTMRREPPT